MNNSERPMIHPESQALTTMDNSTGSSDAIHVSNFVEHTYFFTFRKQLVLLLKRNFQILSHYRWFVFIEVIAAPLFFFLILYGFQQGDYANQKKSTPHPQPYPLGPYGACQSGNLYSSSGCVTFMYTPDNANTRAILSIANQNNAARGGPSLNFENGYSSFSQKPSEVLGFVPVADDDFIYDYAFANPNVTMFAISFDIADSPTQANYRYNLWYNYSLVTNGSDYYSIQLLRVMHAIDEAIILYSDNPTSSSYSPMVDIQLKDWPSIASPSLTPAIINRAGNIFFVCATITILFLTINVMVYEREFRLKEAMTSMGLLDSVYYLAWFICFGTLVIFNALFSSAFGYMFQFQSFKSTSWPIVYSNFLLFGFSLVAMGILISACTSKMNTGILIALFPLLAALTFQVFIFSNTYFGYIWYAKGTMPLAVGWVLSARLPYFNFGRIFLDMNTLSAGTYSSSSDTYIPGPGMGLDMLYTRIIDVIPNKMPTYKAGGPMANPTKSFQPLLFYLCSISLDLLTAMFIIRRQNHSPSIFRVIFFYLGRKIRDIEAKVRGSQIKNKSEVEKLDSMRWLSSVTSASLVDTANDPSVVKEREMVRDFNNDFALRVVNLRKVFTLSSWWQFKNKKEKIAVEALNLGIEKGVCLAFLGQNGAGKTTSLSILYGFQQATFGDALIFGHSIRDEPEKIRELMGVCPQHDILFDDLSAVQHIQLYGGLKGCTNEEIERVIAERLAIVKLDKVKDQPTRTFSGGMKRRLSVVIATIGDPRVIVLDEPTTGMDPVNRRHVWKFIQQFKQGRVVLLTTHSMEEADILGDRVAILANGQLKAIGSSLSLKNRFGAGYKISVVTNSFKTKEAMNEINRLVPDAMLQDASAGAIIYNVPRASLPSVSKFIKWLESDENAKNLIKAWGMSQTSLEEIFLYLIRQQ